MIVAASPPTEDAVVATHPLTKQDLIDYLASGCKTKDKWRFLFLLSLTILFLFFMFPLVSFSLIIVTFYLNISIYF